MNLVRFCRNNRYAIYLLTLFLTGAGLVSVYHLPSNIYPELNFPRIMILAHSGDLAPDAMLLTVTRPLEESVSTVLGVRRVRSKTIRGAAEISVLFNPDMDMQYALQLVQARVSSAHSTLPPDTEVEVERVTPTVFPVLSLILNGNVSLAAAQGGDLGRRKQIGARALFQSANNNSELGIGEDASDRRHGRSGAVANT